MPDTTVVLKSEPGIKRDGTKFDGNFYTDGQWVRWQRGMPRKIGGYKATQKYLTEISRGFSNFTQMNFIYCHSGGASTLERFTIDATANSSIVTDRTPVAVAATGTATLTGASTSATGTATLTGASTSATGTITLATGAAGSIDTLTVNGVSIISGAVAFTTDLSTTATALAANINAHTSVPDYTAVAVGTTVTITAVTSGAGTNGFFVAATYTTLTGSTTNMTGGGAGSVDSITVNGVTITSGSVAFTTSLAVTATAVAANINAYTSVPDYTAVAVGAVITITAVTSGAGSNGFAVAATYTTLTGSTTNMAGGGSGSVNSITVNGVTITSGSVAFNTDLSTTATAVAANITAFTSTPNYSAVAVGAVITITAATLGQHTNGFVVVANTTTITTSKVDMYGGSDALIASAYNMWMFDYQYDSSSNQNYIMAHVSPNQQCICNSEGGQIFFGDVLGTGILQSVNLPANTNATGGIVSLHPYMFYYGTDGIIGWSVPGEPTNLTDFGSGAGVARVWGQKIVKGLPLRAGSGTAPAGIFWAYDAVIRATFTGGATVFQFDVIATDTSIMNQNVVVDYDGVFFWCGVDRFMMFNGVVREVPNQMNLNYFFDGLNKRELSKVFAFKVPRYGEVWWCYPRGEATECTHAVIYNVRENTWYDTELPANGRSAGSFNNSFAAPILAGAVGVGGDYRVWVQEQGVDELDGNVINPIRSFFETADLSSLIQGRNEYLRVTRIEPDFVQNGDMTVQVTGRANARAPEVFSSTFTFIDPNNITEPYQEIVMMKEQRRELRVRFESNAVYGDYQMGQIIGHISTGDKTVLG